MELLGTLPAKAGFLGITVLAFIFVLAIVVFFHELGHFLVARWCKVDVKTFSIGFGKELFGWTDRRGTRWRVAAIPLGGYVKFAGDADGASTPDMNALEKMSEREKKGSFYHKNVGQRSAIVAAGPIANFILAIAIFSATIYAFGRPVVPPKVDKVEAGSAAAAAGIEAGDVIVAISGTPITSFSDIQRGVTGHGGDRLDIVVDRAGKRIELSATPEPREISTSYGKQRIGVLGVRAPEDPGVVEHRTYGLVDSVRLGAGDTWFIVTSTVNVVGKLFSGRESTDQLSGPLRIGLVSGQVATTGGFMGLINLAALLSVSIGLINLVPIPLLDGGHLLYFGIEALRGHPLNERAQEFGFRVGLTLVGLLMLFVTWNDLVFLKAFLGFGPT